ncbi:hypothetical protein B0T26DRAFT_754658 [Lasiosphaeria miniovina]|uniref:Dynamin N-terminal domain-containing protein n=1 Tax=Lasiosphaeria miniovina TaxID=1954250 RepID=A0AA40A563_9PEZI|nr:uncharacterized protein B0T26DRAFT_754658 [Lasiosphaeria miniovina]KAK0709452.1 hypothetical protein B0T26DRAFT_754658 [Lasiosphaeria miniovina]
MSSPFELADRSATANFDVRSAETGLETQSLSGESAMDVDLPTDGPHNVANRLKSTGPLPESTETTFTGVANSTERAIEHDRTLAEPSSFAWNQCRDKDISARVWVKQQAVDDALKCLLEIRHEILTATRNETSGHEASDNIFDQDVIIPWMDEIAKLNQEYQELEILVGVAGQTGAGKSTILNTLLEVPELLPSSNSEASTSCACKVLWNRDNRPQHRFRAEIVFRSRKDVAKELEATYKEIRDRDAYAEDEEDDDEDRMHQIAEMEAQISEGLKKISAVWGVKEEELKDMTAESLLESNQDVLALLDTTKRISSADADEFSEIVKPYIDASDNTYGFKAWPLINEAKLFIKADILKHGLVLVDLPGLADAVESRAQVTERFLQALEITVIVVPARRAVDGKTGVQLMSDYQTVSMQMDDKFNKKRFCVVVSQIDEIDCDVFVKSTQSPKTDKALQDDNEQVKRLITSLRPIESQIKTEQKTLTDMDSKLNSYDSEVKALTASGPGAQKVKDDRKFITKLAGLKIKKKDLNKERRKQKTALRKLGNSRAGINKELETIEGRLRWACMRMNGERIAKAIRSDFKERQKKLLSEKTKGAAASGGLYDGSVEVFPVSAMAYRDLQKPKKVLGFPSLNYTGIPCLSRWIRTTTLDKRNEHLDRLLNALCRLFLEIQSWSTIQNGSRLIASSRQSIEDILLSIHFIYREKLGDHLNNGSRKIREMNPLGDINARLQACTKVSGMAVTRWPVKNPEDKTSSLLMHWSAPLLQLIAKDWFSVFHVQIPAAENPLMDIIEAIWEAYLDHLRAQVQAIAPGVLPHLEAGIPAIQAVKNEIRDKIRKALEDLSRSSSKIHPQFVKTLKEKLNPIFAGALKEKGENQFLRQRAYLRNQVKAECRELCHAGFTKMVEQYIQNVGQLAHEFSDISAFATDKVKGQIALLLNNFQFEDKNNIGSARDERKLLLQQRLGAIVMKWLADWRAPKQDDHSLVLKNVEIPFDFAEESNEAAEDVENGQDEIGDENKEAGKGDLAEADGGYNPLIKTEEDESAI